MHEFSLAEALLRQVAQVHSLHPDSEVEAVCVQMGPLSGVEPCLLLTAFQHCSAAEYGREIHLEIENVPLSVECEDCGGLATLEKMIFACPHCEGLHLRVLAGDSLMLVSVDLNTDTPMGAQR